MNGTILLGLWVICKSMLFVEKFIDLSKERSKLTTAWVCQRTSWSVIVCTFTLSHCLTDFTLLDKSPVSTTLKKSKNNKKRKEIGLHTKQLEYQAILDFRQLFAILSDNSNQCVSLRRHKIKEEIKTNKTKQNTDKQTKRIVYKY